MAKATDQSKTGFVTVATVRSRAEARQLAATLEAAGVESLTTVERGADSQSTRDRGFHGVKVQVRRAEVPRALQALQLSRPKVEESIPIGRTSDRRAGSSRFQLNLTIWQEAVLSVAVMIALAALLALWLF